MGGLLQHLEKCFEMMCTAERNDSEMSGRHAHCATTHYLTSLHPMQHLLLYFNMQNIPLLFAFLMFRLCLATTIHNRLFYSICSLLTARHRQRCLKQTPLTRTLRPTLILKTVAQLQHPTLTFITHPSRLTSLYSLKLSEPVKLIYCTAAMCCRCCYEERRLAMMSR